MSTTPSRLTTNTTFPSAAIQHDKPTIRQYYEQIVQQQKISQRNPTQQLIAQFSLLNKQIHSRIHLFTKLTQQYKQRVQQSFFISFTKVIQKMSNDLVLAQQAYKNIDKEIMTKQRCINLNDDKLFFIEESNYYKNQLDFRMKEVQKLKEKNFLLVKENTGLKENMFKRIKENMFWKQKCRRLEKKFTNQENDNIFNNEFINADQNAKNNEQMKKNTSMQRMQSPYNKKRLNITNHPLPHNSIRSSSLGMQSPEQRKMIENKKIQEKHKLFVDIKKQLKLRDKKPYDFDMIVKRGVSFEQIKQQPLKEQHSGRRTSLVKKRKNQAINYNPQQFTPKFTTQIQKQSPSHAHKSNQQTNNSLNSTFSSNFNKTPNLIQGIVTQRSIHTSVTRRQNKNKPK